MTKLSRPVQILLGVGLIVIAYLFSTGSDSPAPKKRTTLTKKTAQADAEGFTPEDYKAQFARYTARQRDAFKPLVVPSKAAATSKVPASKNQGLTLAGSNGAWTLTGISALNGAKSALIENSATKESVFLTLGENWHGYYVSTIGEDNVILLDPQGKDVKLAFLETAPTTKAPGSEAAPANAVATPATTTGSATLTTPAATRRGQ